MTSNQYTPYAPYSSYNYHYGQSSTEPYSRDETTSASNIASQTSSHHPPMNPIFLPNPANSSSYRALSPSHHMQDSGYGWGREKAGSASSWEPQQSQPQYQHQQYNYPTNSSTAPEVQPTTENQPWLDSQRQRGDHRGEQRGEREQQQGLLMLGEAATAVTGEQTRINEDNTAEITTRTPSQVPGERRKSKADQRHEFTGAGTVSTSGTRESPADEHASLEAEMRAMMARMRELNGRDPALVSRIWEEERRKKTPTPKTPAQAHVQAIPAQPVQTTPPSTSNRATTTRAKETGTAETGKGKPPAPSARSTRPTSSAPTVPSPRSAPPAATPIQEIPTSATPFGRVWPMEKNPQLALSVWKYITSHNRTNVNSGKIFSILETKPSYVEFCERLEGMGLQIDRTILINQMLEAVPAVVPVAAPYVKAALSQPVIKNGSISQPSVPIARMEALNPAGERKPDSLSSAPVASTEPTKPGPKSPSGIAPVSLPLAPMEPTMMGSNAPTSKAEAAKMRSFNEIIDLTQVSDETQSGRPSKKPRPLSPPSEPTRHADSINATASKSANPPATPRLPIPATIPPLVDGSRPIRLVEVIDYKKSLRRNEYDAATIARDVLIASGRHLDERPLNEHLVILKQQFPSLVTNDADLSTLRWDLLDPESPPPWGYGQGKLYHVIGGEDSAQSRLPASATKRGKRGRPPQQQQPATSRLPNSTDMNEPRQPDLSIGYKAFTPTLYGPDGKPLPKKRGRPFGWRKAIHGSPAAQANTTRPKKADALQEQPSQPTSIHNATGSNNVPTFVDLSSTLVSCKTPPYHSFKCKWQDCKAELHNLETLKKHVYKIHGKQKFGEQNECLWEGCSNEVAIHDFKTNMIIDRVVPKIFLDEGGWREHMEEKHLKPLSWELGDGPAGGLSDAHDSESYLSDAQGRRVTPRLSVDPDRPSRGNFDIQDPTISDTLSSILRGRGRTPRTNQERDAREAQQRLISQKTRIGGPGMDRGGATLVNDKRRKGFSDHDETEEELVDADT